MSRAPAPGLEVQVLRRGRVPHSGRYHWSEQPANARETWAQIAAQRLDACDKLSHHPDTNDAAGWAGSGGDRETRPALPVTVRGPQVHACIWPELLALGTQTAWQKQGASGWFQWNRRTVTGPGPHHSARVSPNSGTGQAASPGLVAQRQTYGRVWPGLPAPSGQGRAGRDARARAPPGCATRQPAGPAHVP